MMILVFYEYELFASNIYEILRKVNSIQIITFGSNEDGNILR